MGEHGAGKGLGLPGEGHCLAAVGVGDDVHGVMLPGAAAALLDPPDPLPDRVEPRYLEAKSKDAIIIDLIHPQSLST